MKPSLKDEISNNEEKGMAKVTAERLRISDRAHLVFEMHRRVDGLQEEKRKSNNEMLGTTKKGIGPAYASKASRNALRVADLMATTDFQMKFAL